MVNDSIQVFLSGPVRFLVFLRSHNSVSLVVHSGLLPEDGVHGGNMRTCNKERLWPAILSAILRPRGGPALPFSRHSDKGEG